MQKLSNKSGYLRLQSAKSYRSQSSYNNYAESSYFEVGAGSNVDGTTSAALDDYAVTRKRELTELTQVWITKLLKVCEKEDSKLILKLIKDNHNVKDTTLP